MARSSFRQAELERILRAAKAVGATVKIDLRRLVVTVYHPQADDNEPSRGLAPDGLESWD